ncbi:MAG: glycosyltransferase family 39 protein [Solirubrobacterales bacterium]|nr:glycosyltransferase family 39 protein [Solirubrobacterales bacterium]
MFGHDLNPNYFANPPAFTYVLHFIFAVWFGGRAGVSHEFALYPGDVFAVARVAAALLGVAALWLLYLCGARLFGRAVGLLAAALEGVAFLPVFYSHLALNDVPTLAPLTLSLVGSAGILRRGRTIDYLIAGVGLGLGCATKYTAGIVLVPLVAAGAIRYLDEAGRGRGGPGRWGVGAPVGLVLAGVAAVGAFVVADPYALLDFHAFHAGLVHQSTVSSESQGKLGAPRESGIAYYLWSFTWGLGWIPAIAAAGGAVSVWWRDRRAALLLVPAPLLFLAFMGLQSRYYGRWLMPIFPIACLLAALFTLQGAGALARGARRLGAGGSLTRALGAGLAVAGAAALLAQGVIYSVHSDVVLARADTRNLMRAWMVAHVPANSRVVVEPVVPDAWVQDLGHPLPGTSSGDRWIKYSSLRGVIAPDGALAPEHSYVVSIEDYERTLAPALIDWYERGGYCWVLSGSTQSGRAFADPRAVPRAIAYYRELRRRATVAHAISPLTPGSGSVPFGFDWTFDYYPLSYARPGPEMVLYRLHGGLCG